MPDTPTTVTKGEVQYVRKLLVRLTALLLFLLLLVFWQSYEGRRQVVGAQRIGCERGKADRTAIAAALRAQSTYLNLVLKAQSVQSDVKKVAVVNQRQQNLSAVDLESRTGAKLDCRRAYPWPTLLPLP